MADNFVANAGAGGDTFAADEILSVKYPRSKIVIGADGSNDGDVSSANPLPVTGTITAVTAITNAVTVNSHAVTNAGTFAVQVDGAGLTALQKIDDPVHVDDAAFTAATSSVVAVGGIVTADSVDSGDVGAFAMLANRQQKVTLYDSAGVEASIGGGTQYDEDTASATGQKLNMAGVTRADTAATQVDTDGDRTTLIVDASGRLHVNVGNTVTVNSHAVTNAGTFVVQENGAALTALQLIDDPVFQDDAAYTIGTSKVMVAGGVVDDASTDAADEGDAAAIRITTDRKQVVHPQPHTTGGLSTARSLDLDESEEEIKASAGMVYGWNITNFRTSTVYVKFYNATAANVTVGTTTPLFTLAIPGNASDDTMLAQNMGGMGITFDTAITWAATTGLADNDTGAPAANDVAGTVWYK